MPKETLEGAEKAFNVALGRNTEGAVFITKIVAAKRKVNGSVPLSLKWKRSINSSVIALGFFDAIIRSST